MDPTVVVLSILLIAVSIAVFVVVFLSDRYMTRQRDHYELQIRGWESKYDEMHQILTQYMATQLEVPPPEQRAVDVEPERDPIIPPAIEAHIASMEGASMQQELRQDVTTMMEANRDITEDEIMAQLFEFTSG